MFSKKKKSQKHEQELIEVLISASKNEELFEAFLSELLTPGEYAEIATRWQIVKRLAQGEPQRTIARDLGIGIATVTRGSRELAKREGGFAAMVKKLKIK